MRSVRTPAAMRASGVSWLTPSAPYACIARSMTRPVIEGTTNCSHHQHWKATPRQVPDLGHANLLQGPLSFEFVDLGGTRVDPPPTLDRVNSLDGPHSVQATEKLQSQLERWRYPQ